MSNDFDSLGAMAKSTRDLALVTELVLTPEARGKLPEDGYVLFLRKDFDGMRIGFADPKTWSWPENLQPQYRNSREQLVSLLWSRSVHEFCNFHNKQRPIKE